MHNSLKHHDQARRESILGTLDPKKKRALHGSIDGITSA